MLLDKQITISVFQVDDEGTFDNIGEVNEFDSLIWPDKFNSLAEFELWAPITEENAKLLKKDYILWCGGDNAAVIKIVKSAVDTYGVKKYNIKGRTLEAYLLDRNVWDTYNASNKYVSTIMYDLVDINFINPTLAVRKFPWLELTSNQLQFGGRIDYQKTGGQVYDAIEELATNADIGFNILFKPKEKKMVFEVIEGVDRTINQSIVDPVEFSTDLEDILSSSYYSNSQDHKNVALVSGEDEGTNRKRQIAGDGTAKGMNRRELDVDARDLQSETKDANGNDITLTPAQYANVLITRGNEKLSEHQIVQNFDANIRVFGDVQYEFGVDYKKGDKVTIRDKQLDVLISARITAVEEDFNDGYALVLTFGYSYPSINQKIRSATK